MGLGKVEKNNGLYLSIAGGYIWDKKAGKEHPEFKEQEYTKIDGEIGVRSGAQYADLSGLITGVQFRSHDQYGESINVNIEAGEETFILSISTNNRYSQDMMKLLLKADLEKEVFIKPYDFTDTKTNKRVQGISFRQDGEKIDLKTDLPDELLKEKDWFKNATKKKIKRFFEDLSDYFVGEIEEKVIPLFPEKSKTSENKDDSEKAKTSEPAKTPEPQEASEEQEAPEPQEAPKVTPLKMKRFLKEYIDENYEDKKLPNLDREGVITWYNLAVAMEELPFLEPAEQEPDGEVDEDDIQAQLDALAGN